MTWFLLLCWALWAFSRLRLIASKERAPSLLILVPRSYAQWGQVISLLTPIMVLILRGHIYDWFLWGYCAPVTVVAIVLIRAYCPAFSTHKQRSQ